MRNDLDINFKKLVNLSKVADNYSKEIETLQEAFTKLINVVDDNKGLAAEELKSTPDNMSNNINKLMDGLSAMSEILIQYDAEMTGIISPVNEGANLKINIANSKNDILYLKDALYTLYADKKNAYSYIDLDTYKGTTAAGNNEYGIDKTVEVKFQENLACANAYYRQFTSVMEKYNYVVDELYENYFDKIEVILDKIDRFSDTDNEFENRGEKVFEVWQDLKWRQTTTGKIILGIVAVGACVLIVIFAAPVIAAAGAMVGASAAVVAGTTAFVVGVAKGAIITGVALSSIETVSAIRNKRDIDSVFASSLCNGVISGAITAGFTFGAGYAVKAGIATIGKAGQLASTYAPATTAKVVQAGTSAYNTASSAAPKLTAAASSFLTNNGTKMAERAVMIGGDTLAEKAVAEFNGAEFNLKKSLGNSISKNTIDATAKTGIKKLDDMVDCYDIPEKFKKTASIVYRGGVSIAKDEAKSASKSFIENAVEVQETGEGSYLDTSYETNITDPAKVTENILKGNNIDPNSIIKTGTEKVLDYIETGLTE